MTQINPLKQFFRQPAIYLRLPSNGEFWAAGSLNLPANNELPVLPMTAIDEINYRTPDALFNGSAVINVIQSCMPSIVNAWETPATDIDSILVAIRIASYGHVFDVASTCPACKNQADYSFDLRKVIDGLTASNYTTEPLIYGDLALLLRPMNYKSMTNINNMSFEHQKSMQALNENTTMPEQEKLKAMGEAMRKIADISILALGSSIASIRTPTAVVTESAFINELLLNCDRQLFTLIQDRAVALRATSSLKPLEVKCTACSHEYKQAFTLDLANFFANAS